MKLFAQTLLIALILSGCVQQYSLIRTGVNTVGQLQVTASADWNQAPSHSTPSARSDSRTWTKDGLILDRLMLISGVKDGETILKPADKTTALPVFRADMLPNEIEELVESSIVKLYGEGSASVSTSNLRPQGFGEYGGFMFDLAGAVSESPDYRGLAGAFVDEDELFLMIYLAADPNYFDKHKAEVETLIKSATLTRATIRRP